MKFAIDGFFFKLWLFFLKHFFCIGKELTAIHEALHRHYSIYKNNGVVVSVGSHLIRVAQVQTLVQEVLFSKFNFLFNFWLNFWFNNKR